MHGTTVLSQLGLRWLTFDTTLSQSLATGHHWVQGITSHALPGKAAPVSRGQFAEEVGGYELLVANTHSIWGIEALP